MARNAEKGQTMLNRFYMAKQQEGKFKALRPYLATECKDLGRAEKWRRQVINEFVKKVSQIQNAGLGEYRIRDLNDEINKLMREKGHWEDQIIELGGTDHRKHGPKMLDHDGRELPGNRGYKYYGVSKDLPGVRDLWAQEPPKPTKRTRGELGRLVDADYYGYRDDDDGVLLLQEAEEERRVMAEALERWQGEREQGGRGAEERNIYAVRADSDSEGETREGVAEPMEGEDNYMKVPTQEEVEEALLRRRKMELLEKYASETLMAQGEEAKTLLGLTN